MSEERAQFIEKYGHVRMPIHTDFQGEKFVAVRDAVYHSPNWPTFTDFLLDYLRQVLSKAFGRNWFSDEVKKERAMRHPIVRWYEAVCRLQNNTRPGPNGIRSMLPDGPTQAYLSLAYDLFVVADNARLETEVLKRLSDRIKFQSARYELFVAATMIRAGFEIDFEDESDNSTSHPEFIAKHKFSDAVVAVEAKVRERRGVLGMAAARREDPNDIKLSIDHLIVAAEKKTPWPLIVFIDANMPPEMANGQMPRWIAELEQALPVLANGLGEEPVFRPSPFALFVITNVPHDYAAPGESSARSVGFTSEPNYTEKPLQNRLVEPAIAKALEQVEFPQLFIT